MRITHSFLLRLLIDPANPHMLRGTLHVVTDSHEYTFADKQALLELLDQLSVHYAAAPAIEVDPIERLDSEDPLKYRPDWSAKPIGPCKPLEES